MRVRHETDTRGHLYFQDWNGNRTGVQFVLDNFGNFKFPFNSSNLIEFSDLNECQLRLHTCQTTQRCDNTVGSYHCVRMAGCGTGYTYNTAEELCEDDDECQLGTHNCGDLGNGYQCRNTQGSYRCDPVRRAPPTLKTTSRPLPTSTTQLTIISGQRKACLPGYSMNNRGDCVGEWEILYFIFEILWWI